MIICITPLSRTSPLFSICAKNRLDFFDKLNEMNFISKLIDVITSPATSCYMDGTIKPEQHSCCAAQVLHELVEKLSVEDTGVYLLLPLATTPMLIENLVHCIVNKSGRDYSLTHSLLLTHSLTYLLTHLYQRWTK